MTRTHTIHAAILGEHGNCDEQYPRPLTCGECGGRPDKQRKDEYYDKVTPTGNGSEMHCEWGVRMTWHYVTESDPLPEGWRTITSPTYHHSFTLCPSCFADRAEPREEEAYSY